MADESKYSERERIELVDRILSNSDQLPSETRERYVGPKEASISTTRGVIFGALGAALGGLFGNVLDDGDPAKGKKKIPFAIITGLAGATMGLFSGSNEAREGARQVRRMQRRIEDLHGQNQVLKDEVRDQQPEAGETRAESSKVAKPATDEIPEVEEPETVLAAAQIAEHETVETERSAAL